MPDYFDSPKRKLTRAKTNIRNLEAEWGRFINDHPWTAPVETNSGSQQKEFKITFTREFPDIFSDLTARALNNLRSVLDHCGYASAVASGKVEPRHAYFPFGTDADFNRSGKGNCTNVPPDVVTLMRSFKPYKTWNGNQLLWAINNTANLDKHGIVTPMAARPIADTLRVTPSIAFRSVALPAILYDWNTETNELSYRIFLVDEYSSNHDFRVTIDIAFGKIDVVGGQPAIGLLHAMAGIVEGILMAIEAETRRLFPAAFL